MAPSALSKRRFVSTVTIRTELGRSVQAQRLHKQICSIYSRFLVQALATDAWATECYTACQAHRKQPNARQTCNDAVIAMRMSYTFVNVPYMYLRGVSSPTEDSMAAVDISHVGQIPRACGSFAHPGPVAYLIQTKHPVTCRNLMTSIRKHANSTGGGTRTRVSALSAQAGCEERSCSSAKGADTSRALS
jgi:hypothetical protein